MSEWKQMRVAGEGKTGEILHDTPQQINMETQNAPPICREAPNDPDSWAASVSSCVAVPLEEFPPNQIYLSIGNSLGITVLRNHGG